MQWDYALLCHTRCWDEASAGPRSRLKKKGKLNYWLRRRRRYYGRKGYLVTTPLKHLNTMVFMNGLYFALCSGNERRNLRFSPRQIEVHEQPLPAVHKRPLKKPPRWPEKDKNPTKSYHCANIETQTGVLWHCVSTISPCTHQEHILLALMVYGHINLLLKSNRLPFWTF